MKYFLFDMWYNRCVRMQDQTSYIHVLNILRGTKVRLFIYRSRGPGTQHHWHGCRCWCRIRETRNIHQDPDRRRSCTKGWEVSLCLILKFVCALFGGTYYGTKCLFAKESFSHIELKLSFIPSMWMIHLCCIPLVWNLVFISYYRWVILWYDAAYLLAPCESDKTVGS